MSGQNGNRYCLVGCTVVLLSFAPTCIVAVDALRRERDIKDYVAEARLQSIAAAEGEFLRGDKDGDGVADFGTLAELAAAKLVEPSVGSGTAYRYEFSVALIGSGATQRFVARAHPVVLPDGTLCGETWFAIDVNGKLARSYDGPVVLVNGTDAPASSPRRPTTWRDYAFLVVLLIPVGFIAGHILGEKASRKGKTP